MPFEVMQWLLICLTVWGGVVAVGSVTMLSGTFRTRRNRLIAQSVAGVLAILFAVAVAYMVSLSFRGGCE